MTMTVMGQIEYLCTQTDEQVIKDIIQKHFGPTFSYYTPNNSLKRQQCKLPHEITGSLRYTISNISDSDEIFGQMKSQQDTENGHETLVSFIGTFETLDYTEITKWILEQNDVIDGEIQLNVENKSFVIEDDNLPNPITITSRWS